MLLAGIQSTMWKSAFNLILNTALNDSASFYQHEFIPKYLVDIS